MFETVEQFWIGILIGYGTIGLTLGIGAICIFGSEKRKQLFEIVPGIAMALATIVLVSVTYLNLKESEKLRESSQEMLGETKKLADETGKMATETKRLADITVEQFKIKSYPTFLLTRSNPVYEEDVYKDSLEIENKGEITAFDTSVITFYGQVNPRETDEEKMIFILGQEYVYEGKDSEKVYVMDFEKKILPNTKLTLTNTFKENFIKLVDYQIVIVRHKVPYDQSYSYETFCYKLERKKRNEDFEVYTLHWQIMDKSKSDELIESFYDSHLKANGKRMKVERFFVDYPERFRIQYQ